MPLVKVSAGHHQRAHCPLKLDWPYPDRPSALQFGDVVVPVQFDGNQIVFIPPVLERGESATGVPIDATGFALVSVYDSGTAMQIDLAGEPFTSYHYSGVPSRPYFWPVLAPGGIPVTRAFPMIPDVPGETHDHIHQKSLYCAFGDVDGVNNWDDEEGHGYTIHRSRDEVLSGPVFGRFSTTSDWTDASGAKLLEQKLACTVWRGSETLRLMDVDVALAATERDLLFGDTKEGGILAVRVASALDVPRGGRIENAYGGSDEGETWGKAAHWCDYSGVVGGESVGIAVLDHPTSFRYPTYWHVRNYGLMAANPFALSAYTGGAKDGSHLLPRGESLTFRYRVVVHQGDASSAGVREQYLGFVSPPRVLAE